MRSKPLLDCARQPLGVRNHCSGVIRSHSALEIAARASFFVFDNSRRRYTALFFCTVRSELLHGRAWQPLRTRNHCLGMLPTNQAFEINARAAFLFVGSFLKHCIGVVLSHIVPEIVDRACSEPLGARNHCSGMLRSHLRPESMLEQVFFFDSI